MDGDHKSDIFYEDSNIISDEDSSNTYETPKPFGKCQIVGLLSYTCTLNSRYNIPRYSKILDITNKSQLPSYFI